MRRTAGYSASSVLAVQSPVAETISSGRGAIVAAISTLVVSRRSEGGFSHRQPPCMCSEIMFTGTATLTRSSTAASRKGWAPAPAAPRHGRLDGVGSGREQEGLGAAPRLAGDRERVALDVGQRLEEVQAADRVPQL